MDDYVNYDVTDKQWKRVQPLLPPEYTGKKGRPRKDNRKMLNGMLWMNHSGAQWRQLPERYGPWQSVYARFAKWRDDGVWESVFSELSQDVDTENLSIDSTCVKVHENSHGEGKTENKAIGRTKGTKLPRSRICSFQSILARTPRVLYAPADPRSSKMRRVPVHLW